MPPPRGPGGARENSTLACRRFWANLFPLFSSTSRSVDKFRVSPLETSLEVGGREGCPESLSAGLCWWSSLTLPGQGPGIFRCDLEPDACCLQKQFLVCFYFVENKSSKRKALEARASAGGPWSSRAVGILFPQVCMTGVAPWISSRELGGCKKARVPDPRSLRLALQDEAPFMIWKKTPAVSHSVRAGGSFEEGSVFSPRRKKPWGPCSQSVRVSPSLRHFPEDLKCFLSLDEKHLFLGHFL